MNPTSDQALRTALDHETTSIVRQLQADNEHLRNELATANANLANPYLRAVLSLIDKHRFQHRDMGAGSLEVMLIEFYRFPRLEHRQCETARHNRACVLGWRDTRHHDATVPISGGGRQPLGPLGLL
jgi:hypothetical protein